MKKLLLALALFAGTSIVVLAHEVIMSSCGGVASVPGELSVEQILEIYDALEAVCPE